MQVQHLAKLRRKILDSSCRDSGFDVSDAIGSGERRGGSGSNWRRSGTEVREVEVHVGVSPPPRQLQGAGQTDVTACKQLQAASIDEVLAWVLPATEACTKAAEVGKGC